MLLRTEQNAVRNIVVVPDAVEREIPLHGRIMQWLKLNNVPYIHARTDRKSGINPGAPDFAFPYRGKTFWLEIKSATGKRSRDQLAWALLAEQRGATVHVIRSWEEFLSTVSG